MAGSARRSSSGGELHFLHPLDHFLHDAFDGDLVAIAHVVENEHHGARGEAAKLWIALEKRHFRTVAGRGDSGGEPCRPTSRRRRFRERYLSSSHLISGSGQNKFPFLGPIE
jgi:hypothetical protein